MTAKLESSGNFLKADLEPNRPLQPRVFTGSRVNRQHMKIRIIIISCISLLFSCKESNSVRHFCDDLVTADLPKEWKEVKFERALYQGAKYKLLDRLFRKDSSAILVMRFYFDDTEETKTFQHEFLAQTLQHNRKYYRDNYQELNVKYYKDSIVTTTQGKIGITEVVRWDDLNERFIFYMFGYSTSDYNRIYLQLSSYLERKDEVRKDFYELIKTFRWKEIRDYVDCYKNDTITYEVPRTLPRGIKDPERIW